MEFLRGEVHILAGKNTVLDYIFLQKNSTNNEKEDTPAGRGKAKKKQEEKIALRDLE